MKAKKKERQVMQHPRMTNVFEGGNTKQSQQLMEIRPKELENASDWYAWCLYWDIVPLHVKKLHTLVKDLDDKLDEEGAVVSKSKLIDRVIEYRERRQALLFCVDFMLSLTNEETQRQLSRSVTEWDECFAKLESSWGYWFPDVQQMLKCPIDGTKELKLSQMTNGTSADAAMRCPRTRKLRQRRVHQAKPNCVKETASEKESLTRSRRTNDQESCCVMRDSISELENSINDVTSLLEENSKESDVTIQMDNRPRVSTKWSNGDRLFPLALEKAEDQKSDEVQGQRSETGQLEIEELGKHPKLVETRSNRSLVISKSSLARRVLHLEVKAQKEQEELQTRLEKLKREAIQMEIADLHEQLARKARIAEKEREIAEVSSSQGTSFPSVSSVDSFTEDSRCMAETETVEDGAKSNIALSVHLKSENAVKLVHEGKFSAHRRDSKPPTEADEQADNETCRKEAISQPDVKLANQGTSQLITTECIQKLSETFIVDNGRQDVHLETLLVDTKQVLEEDIHLGFLFLLHGMVECVQLTTGILYAKIVIDEFADEISIMETQLGSSKAQTTTSSENGPFIGPAVSWEEMMMQLQFFGKWIKEEVRQLEVNDLVWIVDDNVKRAHYKTSRVLEVYHGSDGRVKSALVKTEDGKLKRPVVKLAPMFYESVFQEKNRAGNVGASHQQAKKVDLEHAG